MTIGTDLIAAERNRQINVEGWTPDHDAEHTRGELANAARAYLSEVSRARGGFYPERLPVAWPWDPSWWKPSDDPVRNLVKAGALIAAEIDRLSARTKDTP